MAKIYLALLLATLAVTGSRRAPGPPPVLREEAVVRVGGAAERWTLVWRGPPRSVCAPEDLDGALTCPCTGFAYREKGELDLVRHRPVWTQERLAHTPLFRAADVDGPSGIDSLAVLPRWPVRRADYAAMGGDGVPAAAIRARPAVRVIAPSDYDHDGRATEFVLQVGTLPCGRREAVVVGVSATDGSLHAFASAAHPERPLVLEVRFWERLRELGSRAADSRDRAAWVEWPCGDHGSETQTELRLWAGPSGIGGTRFEYACTSAGRRGHLISSNPI
jgi:hypothetical protein